MGTLQVFNINKIAAPLLAALALTAALLLAADPEPATPAPAPTAAPAPPRRLAPTPDRPLVLFNFRILQASPDKLDALHARLRDHEIPLLEQHGIFTLAVFVPAGENPEQLVYFITGAEGLTAMTEGWAGSRKAWPRLTRPARSWPRNAPSPWPGRTGHRSFRRTSPFRPACSS